MIKDSMISKNTAIDKKTYQISTPFNLFDIKPDYIINSIADLPGIISFE